VSASQKRALAAAIALIVMTSNSTSTSAIFVAYRSKWGLTPADIGLAFSVYVGTLVPVLLLFGGLPERYGRRIIILIGMLFMIGGTTLLVFAHGLPDLIVARLLQGAGAALGVGSISATFTEAYRGKIGAGQALAVATAIALSAGPVITAIAYDFGAGPNLSYLPVLVLGIGILALVPIFETTATSSTVRAAEEQLPSYVVWRSLRFAMPLVFVSWAATSLYLSLVPAYLAASLHAEDPLIGAGAFLATQLATIFANVRFGNLLPEHTAIPAATVTVAGLALLILGTNTGLWALIVIATILVGGGAGVASGASFAIVGRVGQGQRARIFARLLVAAYLGYSLPSLAIGVIASRVSFTAGFLSVVAALAVITASLSLFRAAIVAPRAAPGVI
jgi:MFS transporter